MYYEDRKNRLEANGWDPEEIGVEDMVVIWGAGASQVQIVREAASDPEVFGEGIEDCQEFLRTTDRDDYWVVSIPPDEIAYSDLDSDPAVVGYMVWGN